MKSIGGGALFRELLARYKEAWEERDANLAIGMFTRDATYLEDPFDKRPISGLREIRDYWAQVPRFQRNISFKHGPVFHLEGSRAGAPNGRHAIRRSRQENESGFEGYCFVNSQGDGFVGFGSTGILEVGVRLFPLRLYRDGLNGLFPRERTPGKPTSKCHEIAPAITGRL